MAEAQLFIAHVPCGSMEWWIYSCLTTIFCAIANVLDIKSVSHQPKLSFGGNESMATHNVDITQLLMLLGSSLFLL